jgi:hypothetical protein
VADGEPTCVPVVFKAFVSNRPGQTGVLDRHQKLLQPMGVESARIALGWIRINQKGEVVCILGQVAA